MPAKIFTWYVIEGKVNFSEYVHDKVLTISDVNAKIDVRELANFLQSKKGINELNLINVEIDSKDVKELTKLTHLTSLTLRNNKLGFQGAGYIGLGNLINLTSLEISNNNIGDRGFAFLIGSKRFTKLTSLNVENNNIVGVWRHHYGGDIALKNLTSLYVEGNGKKFLDDEVVILRNVTRQNTKVPICSGVEGEVKSEGATQKLLARRKKAVKTTLSVALSKQREIVLDTETTGLSVKFGHRIIEIGCVELINRIPTGKVSHWYINPERHIDKGAFKVHGISEEFLKDKPLFSEIAPEFLKFISNDILVIHNAKFDVEFLNMELGKLNAKLISSNRVLDTLPLARKKFPKSPASLNELCKRFDISLNDRTSHGALIDAQLLAKVYAQLSGYNYAA
ncbi:MAG: DNA polymerase III subunit epsilon [Wolbachia endosymbiont of Homalodisca vitripennis]|nr:DNA polymerase III subunit epsilon [Wolbachia endosymbiont of Homalodisca vitripennis]